MDLTVIEGERYIKYFRDEMDTVSELSQRFSWILSLGTSFRSIIGLMVRSQ